MNLLQFADAHPVSFTLLALPVVCTICLVVIFVVHVLTERKEK